VMWTAHPSLRPAALLVRVSVPLSIAVACLVGWEWIHHRTMVAIAVVLLTTVPLFFSPAFRVCFLVFGGFLVFHSSTELTPQKLYFLLGAGVAFAGAVASLARRRGDPVLSDVRPFFAAARAFALDRKSVV